MIHSSESNGVPQNSSRASPMNVKALRASRSVTAVDLDRDSCLSSSNPMTTRARAMVRGFPCAMPMPSQNAATSSTAPAVRRFCRRASQAGLSNSHRSIRPRPMMAMVTPIEKGAAWST